MNFPYDIKCKEYELALVAISENVSQKNIFFGTTVNISEDTLRTELRSVVELMTAISIIQQRLNCELLTLEKICKNKSVRKISGCFFLATLALAYIHYHNTFNPRNASPKNSLLVFYTTVTVTAGLFYVLFQTKVYSQKFHKYQLFYRLALGQAESLQVKINKLIEDKVRTRLST